MRFVVKLCLIQLFFFSICCVHFSKYEAYTTTHWAQSGVKLEAKFQLVHLCPTEQIVFAPSLRTIRRRREEVVPEGKSGSRCRGMAECRMEIKVRPHPAMATSSMARNNRNL